MKIDISHGEFFDRFTILVNKIYNCTNEEDVANAITQLIQLSNCYQPKCLQKIGDKNKNELIGEMKYINKALWEMEDLVRKEEDNEKRLSLSDDIREYNRMRSEVKGDINSLYEDEVEVKDYGTKSY